MKTAHEEYAAEVVGIYDGFLGLLPEGLTRTLPLADVRGILSMGGTILGTTNEGPFDLGPDGKPLPQAEPSFKAAAEQFRRLELEALVVVGGDGSLRIARSLSELGVNLVGVPKTIDNDLAVTERTFGFDTAVEVACQALDRLRTVAAAHHRIMVCEVMGRGAGWIALHAGLASGADVILIPEIPFHWAPLVKMVDERRARGSHFSLIVVAEGATAVDCGPVCQEDGRLGGIGQVVSRGLAERTGVMTRVTVLGHVQRGGTPTATDRVLASRFGEEAVHLLARGTYGQMVALQADEIVGVPLEDAVNHPKLVSVGGQMVRLGRSTGVYFGDEQV